MTSVSGDLKKRKHGYGSAGKDIKHEPHLSETV